MFYSSITAPNAQVVAIVLVIIVCANTTTFCFNWHVCRLSTGFSVMYRPELFLIRCACFQDDNWSQFIRMCVRMGCCCGCQLPPGLKPEGIGGKDVENSQPAHCHNGHPPSEE